MMRKMLLPIAFLVAMPVTVQAQQLSCTVMAVSGYGMTLMCGVDEDVPLITNSGIGPDIGDLGQRRIWGTPSWYRGWHTDYGYGGGLYPRRYGYGYGWRY